MDNIPMANFLDINFKYTDAEEEKLYAPELLDHAYVDINQVLEKVRSREKFLVIGPKGSGKTALSSKLSLMEKSEWDLFVETDILEQFEFQLLKRTGGEKRNFHRRGNYRMAIDLDASPNTPLTERREIQRR